MLKDEGSGNIKGQNQGLQGADKIHSQGCEHACGSATP